jgi:hypothetical protein
MPNALVGIAVAAVLLAGTWTPAQAEGLRSLDEIKAEVVKSYGVEVLRAKETNEGGAPAYALTVMHRGGNANEAFLVSTIVVDASTGKLVPSFRHLPAGYDLPGAEERTTRHESEGLDMRRESHRQ